MKSEKTTLNKRGTEENSGKKWLKKEKGLNSNIQNITRNLNA